MFADHFPPERVLTVVGTNYRTYGPVVASWLNRAFSVAGEFGANYNRSDGLVKQAYAQLPGAPRPSCTSATAAPIARHLARGFRGGDALLLRQHQGAAETREGEGDARQGPVRQSEFFFGVSIKPRYVDFELFHQSAEAENCYGPFSKEDLSDKSKDDSSDKNTDGVVFNWVDETTASG